MPAPRAPLHLLTADDDRGIPWMLEIQFRTLSIPYHLEFAQDGVELLEMLHEKHSSPQSLPSLIPLGLNYGRRDGFETLQALKSHVVWRAIPVILFSTKLIGLRRMGPAGPRDRGVLGRLRHLSAP